MEDSVLSVREAAGRLGVTSQRVRQLIADGSLDARRSSAGWLVSAQAVENRARCNRRGRPASPRTVWAVINLLSSAVDTAAASESQIDTRHLSDLQPISHATAQRSPSEAPLASQVVTDRRLRHHALQLLYAMPDPVDDIEQWRILLSSRGATEHFWAHPGVSPRLADDPDISVGGDKAASIVGDGLSRTERLDLYVDGPSLDRVASKYLLRPDENGKVVMHVVPDNVPHALAPRRGEYVPIAAAAADLLEEGDLRASHAAMLQLHAMRNALAHAYLNPSSKNHSNVPLGDRAD